MHSFCTLFNVRKTGKYTLIEFCRVASYLSYATTYVSSSLVAIIGMVIIQDYNESLLSPVSVIDTKKLTKRRSNLLPPLQ